MFETMQYPVHIGVVICGVEPACSMCVSVRERVSEREREREREQLCMFNCVS